MSSYILYTIYNTIFVNRLWGHVKKCFLTAVAGGTSNGLTAVTYSSCSAPNLVYAIRSILIFPSTVERKYSIGYAIATILLFIIIINIMYCCITGCRNVSQKTQRGLWFNWDVLANRFGRHPTQKDGRQWSVVGCQV